MGLIPRRALDDAAVHYLKVEDFRPDLILENRLAKVIEGQSTAFRGQAAGNLRVLAEGFVDAVAGKTPTPGGGSVAALAGALAAALGEMVCRLTLGLKSFEAHYKTLEESVARLAGLRERLLANIDRDAQSYDAVVAAIKLPQSTDAERSARIAAIESASKTAAEVPMETAELAADAASLIGALRPITIPQASSDLAVALDLAACARRGALENARANLASVHDPEWLTRIEQQLQNLEADTLQS